MNDDHDIGNYGVHPLSFEMGELDASLTQR
jgi:hypothetical protein